MVVGNKVQIKNGVKKSYKVKNGSYITVSSKGVIKAKKAGSGAVITYKSDSGSDVNLVVDVTNPALFDVGDNSLNATLYLGGKGFGALSSDFDISTSIPYQAQFKSAKNKGIISNFRTEIGDDGRLHILGTTEKEGKAKFPFEVNGKKYTIKLTVKK